nr:hypothetical protein [Actinomadura sp. WMMB 499]
MVAAPPAQQLGENDATSPPAPTVRIAYGSHCVFPTGRSWTSTWSRMFTSSRTGTPVPSDQAATARRKSRYPAPNPAEPCSVDTFPPSVSSGFSPTERGRSPAMNSRYASRCASVTGVITEMTSNGIPASASRATPFIARACVPPPARVRRYASCTIAGPSRLTPTRTPSRARNPHHASSSSSPFVCTENRSSVSSVSRRISLAVA